MYVMSADSWIAFHKPSARARRRLFCFPYAGAGASVYRTWANLLPPEIEVFPVQLPGREARRQEPLFTRLDALLEALSQALAVYLDVPFAFFGHSMGGLIAYELTHRLWLERKLVPTHLLLSGRRPPEVPDREEPLHSLPHARLLERLRQLEGTPEEIFQHPELLEMLLPILRADFAVCETWLHQLKPPLPCPLTIYGGVHDGYVKASSLELWRGHTTERFRLRLFAGNHFFLNTARAQVLQAINEDLLQPAP